MKVNPLSFALVVFAVVSAARLIVVLVETRRERIVRKTSKRIKNLNDVNERYKFHEDVKETYAYEINLPSKAKFDRYEMTRLFDSVAWFKEEARIDAGKICQNRKLYEDYKKEVDAIQSEISKEEAENLHIPLKSYVRVEERLFQAGTQKPIVSGRLVCTAKYTSPQGRNSYQKSKEFDLTQLPARFLALQANLLWQGSEERRRQKARAQMTDKLRYSILKRDGFRCQLCGRTAEDGVKLHVDHIIPVSKGGETTWNNLRTLCNECNQGKRDEIE